MRIELITSGDSLVLLDDRLDCLADAWIQENGVTGLFGATKPRESGQAIPQQDGSYWPSRLTAESRTITLTCAASRPSSTSLAKLVDRINALAFQPVTMMVTDANGVRQLSGFIADDPNPSLLVSLRSMTFSLIVYCPDPLKYGRQVSFNASNGTVRVENTGNAPTWPKVSALGVEGLSLSLNGHQIKWAGSSKGLELDFATMVPSQGVVTFDDAFAIPPGVSDINVQTQGAGQLSVSLRPAWR